MFPMSMNPGTKEGGMSLRMCVLYVMIGPSGCGKSTFAKGFAARHSAEIVSTDEIRLALFGNEAIQKQGAKVFEAAYLSVRAHMNHRRNVVFDATNTTAKGRKELLDAVRDCPECKRRVAVLVTPPIETALAQNAMRKRQVPESVIRRQYQQLMEDAETIPEQFDQVIFA